MFPPPPRSTLFPYTTLFRSAVVGDRLDQAVLGSSSTRRMTSPKARRKSRRSVKKSHARALNMSTNYRRSEEHTSELQSQFHLVCRLLLEKKKKNKEHTNFVP